MSSDARAYEGVLAVEDGMLRLPEKYVEAKQYVVRQRSITQTVPSGAGLRRAIWHSDTPVSDENARNPNLDADEVVLKIYGEARELFRVDEDILL